VGYTILHKLNFAISKTKHLAPKYTIILREKEHELWRAMRTRMTNIEHLKAWYKRNRQWEEDDEEDEEDQE
jgi:hypothetical protein